MSKIFPFSSGLVCRVDELPGGITRLRFSTRITRLIGMLVATYRVGDVLVDTGFSHLGDALARALGPKPLRSIVLTHHHEDHTGTGGKLAARSNCPIYLRNPEMRATEGLERLELYRRAWWGVPGPYAPAPMPERIEARDRRLLAVAIPGHSVSHTAFLDESSGAVFAGDLFVTGGVTAVMSHENPYESIASLRRVADLAPARMLTGHGLAIERPAPALREKAERMESAASEALRHHAAGLPEREIVRRVFPRGRAKYRLIESLTRGEFSRQNFVRACLRHAGVQGADHSTLWS